MPGIDDLGGILVPPPSESVRYGQAKITDWNPDTFENAVSWRGVTLRNLPVLSGVDALTYQIGDTVGLLGWGSSNAAGSWWILGRLIIPGAGAGAAAVDWMSGSLGRAVSSQVFADRMHSAFALGQTTTSDTDFGDGTSGGPVVPNIEVSEVGQLLVLWGAHIGAGPITDGGQIGGFMGIDITGPTPEAPNIGDAASIGQSVTVVGATSWSHRISGQLLTGRLYTGRAPGTYSITGKYATQVGGETASFVDRLIVAISS